ncbi:uncharacterized protein YaiE (UPF0345 family) [Caballeronia udeis]|uniref:Uncharacterized protein YaiE (UPF0345 family) n=1 Tax=Caballeronia udeis TaxID=1232866 RepID=A0ABW8N239_9BURK
MRSDEQYEGVSVVKRANIFDDKCISHTVIFADGARKTLGVFLPGTMILPSVVDEVIEVLAGHCSVRQKDSAEWTEYRAGDSFKVPRKSTIEIKVFETTEYICNFDD